jgi:hypothetical protein
MKNQLHPQNQKNVTTTETLVQKETDLRRISFQKHKPLPKKEIHNKKLQNPKLQISRQREHPLTLTKQQHNRSSSSH